jgi:hypothetical protein
MAKIWYNIFYKLAFNSCYKQGLELKYMEVRSPLSAKEIQDQHRHNLDAVTGRGNLPDPSIRGEKNPRTHLIVDLEDDPNKVLEAMEREERQPN